MPNRMHRGFVLSLTCIVAASLCACGGAQSRKAKHMQSGQAFLAAGNFEKARVEFRNALQIAPNDGDARFENGLVDEKLGNVREAAQFYQGAIDVAPDNVRARANLARLYVFSAAPDRALDLIKPAIEKHPDDPELLTVRAAARSQQKEIAGAFEDAERAVSLAPTSEDSVAVLAGLYQSSGQNDKAQALLEASIAKIPQSVDLRLALAQVYAQENRPAETEAQLLKLVELRPKDKAHRLRLAQFYARAGQIDAAEKALRDAISVFPDDREIKVALIDFLATRRSRDIAETELTRMIAAQPADVELKFALARFYEGGKAFDKAEAIYHDVIAAAKLDPAGLTARNRLAAVRARQGDIATALQLANEVLSKSPRDDDALVMRGDIALTKRDPRAAIADLRTVLRDQPNAPGVLRILSRAHLANGEAAIAEETMRHAFDANPKDAAVQQDFAELLLRLNKPEQAKPILAELVKQAPGNLAALDAQFRASLATNDFATAQSAASAIVAARPKAAAGYWYEGMVAEASKHNEEALKLYAQAVDMEPSAIEPLQAQMRLLASLKRIDEAYRRADQLSARNPTVALGPEAKGELLVAQGKNAEAKTAFTEAVARAPNWWLPYRGLANVQLAGKDVDSAMDILTKAITRVEQPEHLQMQLAVLMELKGNTDDAIKEYDAVLARDPQLEAAANNLAMALATYKKDQPSLDRAKQLAARFVDSTNPSYMDTYGWVLLKRGEAAASVPVFERVVAQAPGAPIAHYHLGLAQFQIGSTAEARTNLTKAVNSGSKFAGLDDAKATLDKIAKLPDAGTAPPKT